MEWAFRTSKTVQLELRPVHVRLAKRTRGHALVIMLAYRLVQELARRWENIDTTVPEDLDKLKTLCMMQLVIKGMPLCNCIPKPKESAQRHLERAQVTLPTVLPHRGVHVDMRNKLPSRRKGY